MGELTETVYVVDDEPAIVKALTRLLEGQRPPDQVLPHVHSFLDACRPDGPGCVILDLELPGMNGLELQTRLKDRGITHLIVFLSGHADVPRSVSAMKNGAVDFLTKPVHRTTLLAAVRSALARSRTTQQTSRQHDDIVWRASQLTRRECEVVDSIAAGRLNKQIAAELGIAEKTVKVHRARVMAKLGCRSTFELLRMINSTPGILPFARMFEGIPVEVGRPKQERRSEGRRLENGLVRAV